MSARADVAVYVTDYCPYCTRAKALLEQKGARYRETNVEHRQDLRRWLIEATGQRTVPQVFINGRAVGGFTDLAALDRKGELERLLAEPPSPSMAPLRQ